ncbi:hypothetical protein CLOM_g14106 [Closterium sp. NIES-68]|nr:hypothetical protein CLOM_g14106 [Closterium sp. NIES-68]GJP82045.1 hypothetical protein CLOP_g12170 [Closterium sp. NIES-67]
MSAAAGGDGAALPPVIRRLDEAVVNRIAAGEVIQRPASAVKELVENSLDAGARSVGVVVKDGGLKMMHITDDGHGVRPEDLPILCERHTTSKLREFEDLESIATLGFRGEALASLTYVSHLTVTTMTAGQTHGFRAQYRDGEMQGEPTPCAAVKGTQVLVEDLFFNVAARRKAFRSYSEEYARILDIISRFAIHNHDVCFSCKKYGEARTDLFTPGAPRQAAEAGGGEESSEEGRSDEEGGEAKGAERRKEREEATGKEGEKEEEWEKEKEQEEEKEEDRRRRQLEAIRAVYGAAVARDLVAVDARRGGWGLKGGKKGEGEGVRKGGEGVEKGDGGREDGVRFSMRGFISSANYSAKKTTMVLFINNRLVECSPLRKACEATYAAILPKAARPFLYFSLSLPPHHVDVNVHPTKREVGFLNQDDVVAAVQQAVERAILSSNHTRTFYTQTSLLAGPTPPPKPPAAAAAAADASHPDSASSPATKHRSPKLASPASQRPPEHRLVRTDARIPAGRLHAFFSHRPSSSQPSPSQPSSSQPLLSQPGLWQPLLSKTPSSHPSHTLASERATGIEGGGDEEGGEEKGGEGRGADGGGERGACADDMETEGREAAGGGSGEEEGVRERREAGEAEGAGAAQARNTSADVVAGPSVVAAAVAGPCVQLQARPSGSREQATADSLAATRQAVRKRRSLKGAAAGAGGVGGMGGMGGEERLTSVEELMEGMAASTHSALSALITDCTYVGMVDDRRLLLQHSTSLYLVDVVSISKELMWQQAIRRFGRFNCMTLQPPPLLSHLLLLALEEEERTGGWTPGDGSKEEIVEASVQLLQCKAEMLSEYFAITISPDGHLLSLPLLLDHHTPDLTRLPSLTLSLANEVEWDEERACFASLAAALADLYAFHAPLLPRPSNAQGGKGAGAGASGGGGEGGQVRGEGDGDASRIRKERGPERAVSAVDVGAGGEVGVSEEGEGEKGASEGVSAGEVEAMWRQWEWSIQHVLLPALKFFLKPPRRMARDGTFIKIASLENLYKIFERC